MATAGVLVLAVLLFACAVASFCVASRLARRPERRMRHADRRGHAAAAYRGAHEQHRTVGELQRPRRQHLGDG
ncbi:hypothetical protein ACQP1P_26800 [Dactylosporangium sp. CA-052675]|uniref:hypothetical protein n=1 Tax=Dactylosporangium sp. CA-052675 TaxID=3239927 RepID=UPI003D8E0124